MSKGQDSLTFKISDWVTTQGYPLEMDTATAFRSKKFQVSMSNWYTDPESKESREIDVTAMQMSDLKKSNVLQVNWDIECKAAHDKPWICFLSEAQPSYFFPFHSICSRELTDFLYQKWLHKDIDALFGENSILAPKYFCHGVTQAFTTGLDIPFKAITSAVKACQSAVDIPDKVVDRTGKIRRVKRLWSIAFPVIVIDGKLFDCFKDENGTVQIIEVIRSVLYWKSKYIVHIVTKSELDTFAKHAREATDLLVSHLT